MTTSRAGRGGLIAWLGTGAARPESTWPHCSASFSNRFRTVPKPSDRSSYRARPGGGIQSCARRALVQPVRPIRGAALITDALDQLESRKLVAGTVDGGDRSGFHDRQSAVVIPRARVSTVGGRDSLSGRAGGPRGGRETAHGSHVPGVRLRENGPGLRPLTVTT